MYDHVDKTDDPFEICRDVMRTTGKFSQKHDNEQLPIPIRFLDF